MRNIIFLTMFLSFFTFADSEQIPLDRKITRINAYDNFVFIYFTPAYVDAQGCPNGGDVTVAIDTTGELGTNIYSAALAAASTGKTVGFGINGCQNNRPKVYRIDVGF